MFRVLSRYIIREIIPPFLLGFVLFSSLVMLERVLKLVDLVMEKDLPLDLAVELLLLFFPFTLTLTIPMALLMAVLMAFGRLAADNEILVLRACGFNLARLAVPVIGLGLLLSLGTLWLSDSVAVTAYAQFKDLMYRVLQRGRYVTIQPHVQLKLGGTLLYVDSADNERQVMGGVRLEELASERRSIYADTGIWYREGDEAMVFKLYNAVMHRTVDGSTYYASKAAEFTFRIALAGPMLGAREAGINEIAIRELRQRRQQALAAEDYALARECATEYHRKLALPFACLAFALAGVPLGMLAKKSGRAMGFGLSLLLLFAYYLMSIGLTPVCTAGTLPPQSMWLPNLVFSGAGLWGLWRQVRR